MLSNFY